MFATRIFLMLFLIIWNLTKTKRWKTWKIFLALLMIYNLDTIQGKLKFHWLCYREAGVRYYEPVEKNVGWRSEIAGKSDYELPFIFPYVDFVRYRNDEGKEFDIIRGKDYVFNPVNEFKTPKYLYKYMETKIYTEDNRFALGQQQIINMDTMNIAATLTEIKYAGGWFEKLGIAGEACDDGVFAKTNNSLFSAEIFNNRWNGK